MQSELKVLTFAKMCSHLVDAKMKTTSPGINVALCCKTFRPSRIKVQLEMDCILILHDFAFPFTFSFSEQSFNIMCLLYVATIFKGLKIKNIICSHLQNIITYKERYG